MITYEDDLLFVTYGLSGNLSSDDYLANNRPENIINLLGYLINKQPQNKTGISPFIIAWCT